MPPPPFSLLDFQQIIQRVYDQEINRLRVETGATFTLGGELEVSIDAASGDNIAISDGTNSLVINPDGSINVAGSFSLDPNTKLQIWDGVDELLVNNDGSINVNVVNAAVNTYVNVFNEITSIVASSLSTVVSYTAGVSGRLMSISGSGTNIGTYSVTINGNTKEKRRSMFGGNLNVDFEFGEGHPLIAGDVVALKVVHERPYVGDFNGKINVLED